MLQNAEDQQTQTETPVTETPEAQPAQGSDTLSQEQAPAAGSAQQGEQQQHRSIPDWRFNEVNERMKAAERELAQLRGQLQKPQNPENRQSADPEPKESDFDDFPAYTKALGAWSARQEHARLRREDQQQSQAQSFQERARKADETYVSKVYEAAAKNPALLQKLTNAPDLRPDLLLHGVKESDSPVALAEHLADNPGLILQLNQMPAERALREMGKIEAKLNGPSAPAQPKVSQMPKPVPPVGTGKATGGDGEMNLSKALSILYPS